MKLVRAIGLLVLSLSMLAGCQLPLQRPTPSAPATTPAIVPAPPDEVREAERDVLELLAYFQRAVALSAEDLRKEYVNTSNTYQHDKSESQRLKLVLLLSVPGASFRDDAKLSALLDAVPVKQATQEAPPAYRQLNVLLQKLHGERLKQVREEQKRVDALPKEDAKRIEDLKDQNKKLEQQAAEQKARADELQKKLDAMLNIERELRNRAPTRRAN